MKKFNFNRKLSIHLAALFALAAICLLTLPLSVLANGDDHQPGCPEEHLPASGSFSVNDEWYPFFYGSVSLSNLTYWPRTVEEPSWAHISSDHSVYAHHYYEDRSFTVNYAYRLAVVERPNDPNYEVNPRYHGTVDEYDPEQAMPTPFEHSETLWINVTDLEIPAGDDGKWYHMSAYTRMDVYYQREGKPNVEQFSLKDCQNNVQFWHSRVPEN